MILGCSLMVQTFRTFARPDRGTIKPVIEEEIPLDLDGCAASLFQKFKSCLTSAPILLCPGFSK